MVILIPNYSNKFTSAYIPTNYTKAVLYSHLEEGKSVEAHFFGAKGRGGFGAMGWDLKVT